MQIELNQKRVEFQGVLFDLDGTLVQSTGLISDILIQWAQQQNLNADDVLHFSHGKRTQDIVAHFIQDGSESGHYHALTAKFVAAAQYTQAIVGAAEFIQHLQQHQIPWAVVSSSERELIYARLTAAGLPIPQYIVAAEDIQQGKPHPEGYLKGAALLGLAAQQCLVFEDADAGIAAAEAAHAQVMIIGQHNDERSVQDFTALNF